MDTEDRNEINEQIALLQEQTGTLKSIIKGQLHVISTNAKLLNETIHNVEQNELTLLNATRQLQYALQQNNLNSKLREIIDENSILLEATTETLLRDAQDVLDFVVDIKKGILNPRVLPPAEIIKHLNAVTTGLTTGLTFPLTINLKNIHLLYKIMRITAYSDVKSVIVSIDVPLTNGRVFKLNKAHPVPTRKNGSVYAYLESVEQYVTVDQSTSQYVTLNKDDLDKCKIIHSTYLCASHHPIFTVTSDSPCEVQLYSKLTRKQSPSCTTRIMTLKHTILIELLQPGAWIYVAPNPVELGVTCDKQTETNFVTIEDSGILSIRGKCIITATEFTIHTGKYYGIEKNWNYLPEYNLTIEHLPADPVEANLLNSYNGTNFKLKRIIKHPEELDKVSQKLSDLQETFTQKHLRTPSLYHYGFFTLTSLSLLIILALSVIGAYKYTTRRRSADPRATAQEALKPKPRSDNQCTRTQTQEPFTRTL